MKCETLEKKLKSELEAIETKLASGVEMTEKDLDRIDKLAHALKSLKCYMDMEGADEEWEDAGMSGRRGRAANGRYISRDAGRSYSDGYSRGYAEAMSRHYPPEYPGVEWSPYR